jgi:hypothetical protein
MGELVNPPQARDNPLGEVSLEMTSPQGSPLDGAGQRTSPMGSKHTAILRPHLFNGLASGAPSQREEGLRQALSPGRTGGATGQ